MTVRSSIPTLRVVPFTTVLFMLINFLGSAFAGEFERVSVLSDGSEANRASNFPSLNADGSITVFESTATNLVAEDTNGKSDIFLHNRNTAETIRVSVNNAGVEANDACYDPAVSGNGNFVVYESYATNLVEGIKERSPRIYLYDVANKKTELVSVSASGAPADGCVDASISGDGRFVVFSSRSPLIEEDFNNEEDIYLRDRQNGVTRHISIADHWDMPNGQCRRPQISENGQYIVFDSLASNLISSDLNGCGDIFLYDQNDNKITCITALNEYEQANSDSETAHISANGNFVVFESKGNNLVEMDTNAVADIFLKNLETGEFLRISVNNEGEQANKNSKDPVISGDGKYVVFVSRASNLDPAGKAKGNQVYIHDIEQGTTRLGGMATDGRVQRGNSEVPMISSDGKIVVFKSSISNLVENDKNYMSDIFLNILATE